MKKIILFSLSLLFSISVAYAQMTPSKFSFNIKGGFIAPGKIEPEDADDVSTKASPILKMDLDGILVPKFSMGLYFLYTPIKLKDTDENLNDMAVGITFKPRFNVSESMQIRPGLALGYNHMTNSNLDSPVEGLELTLQIEFMKAISNSYGITAELGFISQPAGGTDNMDVNFPPIVYFGIGIELFK